MHKTCTDFEFEMDSCIFAVLILIISRYEYETRFLESGQTSAGQLLDLNVNEQLLLENEYLLEELQVYKNQHKQSGKRIFFTDEQR